MSNNDLFGEVAGNRGLLYHYTTAQAALGAILPLRQLRASPRAWLNDPLENEPIDIALQMMGDDTLNQDKVHSEFNMEIAQRTKVLCFSMDAESRSNPATAEGRGFGHSAMWSHYADGHRGVCLIIEADALERQIEDAWSGHRLTKSGAVKYRQLGLGLRDSFESVDLRVMSLQRIDLKGPEIETLEHVSRNFDQLFLTKLADWSSENEFRWVTNSMDLGPAFVSIESSLRGVVIGSRFSDTDLDLLMDQMRSFEREIGLAKFRLDTGLPFASVIH